MEKVEGVPSYSVKRKGCFWESGGRARVRVARMRETLHARARSATGECVCRMYEREKERMCMTRRKSMYACVKEREKERKREIARSSTRGE